MENQPSKDELNRWILQIEMWCRERHLGKALEKASDSTRFNDYWKCVSSKLPALSVDVAKEIFKRAQTGGEQDEFTRRAWRQIRAKAEELSAHTK